MRHCNESVGVPYYIVFFRAKGTGETKQRGSERQTILLTQTVRENRVTVAKWRLSRYPLCIYTHPYGRKDQIVERRQQMQSRKRCPALKVGDRARAKTTRRVGRIDAVSMVKGRRYYGLTYDEAPQDRFLATPARFGGRFPRALIEPA